MMTPQVREQGRGCRRPAREGLGLGLLQKGGGVSVGPLQVGHTQLSDCPPGWNSSLEVP